MNDLFKVVTSLVFFLIGTFCSGKEIHFEKRWIKVGPKKIRVQVAESEDQHAYGLMFRKKIGQNEGMLFIFKDLKIRSFWMKNTFIDLSIGFFDEKRKLIDIQEMTASLSLMEKAPPSYKSLGPSKYALEMRKSWFKDNKIILGSRLELH